MRALGGVALWSQKPQFFASGILVEQLQKLRVDLDRSGVKRRCPVLKDRNMPAVGCVEEVADALLAPDLMKPG